ncbi:unnamed protein product [Symbiodinium natans]|uniref:Condensin complex subunit 1 C-terminal domain-containing protein n=1 Tax=Symbiodinium natans TaxID=878477 RepID=A0A812IMG3_9DINO|nr:unnamed protein product [Symbiodinium natans]
MRADIVIENLRDLLECCCDVDASVRKAAHHIVTNYVRGGLPWVQQVIAEAMLGRMENLWVDEISQPALVQLWRCSKHLEDVVRALDKPQRQRWVSLLVRVLLSRQPCLDPKILISDLKLLWRADDDPRRSYAEAEQQLRAYMKSASKDRQGDVVRLLCC